MNKNGIWVTTIMKINAGNNGPRRRHPSARDSPRRPGPSRIEPGPARPLPSDWRLSSSDVAGGKGCHHFSWYAPADHLGVLPATCASASSADFCSGHRRADLLTHPRTRDPGTPGSPTELHPGVRHRLHRRLRSGSAPSNRLQGSADRRPSTPPGTPAGPCRSTVRLPGGACARPSSFADQPACSPCSVIHEMNFHAPSGFLSPPTGMPSDQVYSQPELGFSAIGAGQRSRPCRRQIRVRLRILDRPRPPTSRQYHIAARPLAEQVSRTRPKPLEAAPSVTGTAAPVSDVELHGLLRPPGWSSWAFQSVVEPPAAERVDHRVQRRQHLAPARACRAGRYPHRVGGSLSLAAAPRDFLPRSAGDWDPGRPRCRPARSRSLRYIRNDDSP